MKRGISPIVATALLIVIALVLAGIIFFWARSLLQEKQQKFNEPVENACADVNFQAEASAGTGKLNVVNRGNVPLYGIEVRKKDASAGTISFVGTFRDGQQKDQTITQGATGSINADDLHVGDNLILQAILLSMKGSEQVPYTCAKQSVSIVVN